MPGPEDDVMIRLLLLLLCLHVIFKQSSSLIHSKIC